MAPAYGARLVVDRLEHSFAPHVVVRTRPAINSVGWFREVDTPTRMCIDDEQAILRVETWRAIVREAAFIGRDDASIGRRFFGRIRNWSALLVDAKRPVHRTIRN